MKRVCDSKVTGISFTGLFFFDGRFRPVPLTTTFIGVKSDKQQQLVDMDDICYEKVIFLLLTMFLMDLFSILEPLFT